MSSNTPSSEVHRAKIIGAGVVSAAGMNVASTLASLRAGKRLASAIPFPCSINAPVFAVQGDLPELPGDRNASRSLRLAMAAVAEAMTSAGLNEFPRDARVGVCLGTTVASQLNNLPFYREFRAGRVPPIEPAREFLNANLGEAVADLLHVAGPRMTVVNACSSGTDAIGIAASWIRHGLCDIAIAGGADELSPVPVAGFWSLGVMSTELCCPFDQARKGLNLGEGAGVLIMESPESAARRGRTPTMEVAGFGAACDAHHLTAPHPEGRGLRQAIHFALRQARVEPSAIQFVNAHGTGTQDNDRVEGTVLSEIFGSTVTMLSTKGYTGHTLGAAGGIEAVFTLLGLREGWLPASAGFESAPPDIPVRPIAKTTKVSGEYAMSTSLAFGGNNAALILRRTA